MLPIKQRGFHCNNEEYLCLILSVFRHLEKQSQPVKRKAHNRMQLGVALKDYTAAATVLWPVGETIYLKALEERREDSGERIGENSVAAVVSCTGNPCYTVT